MSAKDKHTRFHEEWLGLVQPIEGLVFSLPVLVDAQITPEFGPELSARFRALLSDSGDDTAPPTIADLRRLFVDLLGYDRPEMLVARDDLPDDLRFYAEEGRQELRPSFAIARGPFTSQAEQAADMLGKSLDGKGNIVVVEGTPGYSVSILRKNCFLDKMADTYPDVNILASQTADWNREKAQTLMETYLTQFGDKIDGVYAFDDGMGLGVISALQGAGKKPGDVKVVTCNLFGEGWDAIKAGWETGSNKQSPIDDAILAIQTALKVVNGIDVPALDTIPTPEITAANVDEFERPTW